jgi:uncharacterized protein
MIRLIFRIQPYSKFCLISDSNYISGLPAGTYLRYGRENYAEKDKEEQWLRFSQHMEEKYSNNGYIKLWIPNSPNEKALKELRGIIENKEELRRTFESIWKEIEECK